MNLYPLLRPLLFSLDPETAHEVTLKLLNAAYAYPVWQNCFIRLLKTNR